jgi:3-oxoacyl-[acyl-carrier protein] reductase
MAEEAIKNKVAIVTGGTRGIGRAIAARLLEEGAHVAICGTRQKSVDEATRVLCSNGDVYGAVADVSKQQDVRSFIAAVQQKFGAIHVLVNNAGTGTFASVEQLSPEDWERMISLNLTGVYYCCHEVLPILRRNGGGDVINISSLAGEHAFAGGAGYNASKFGLNGFSEAMMLDHRNDGIRVTYVMPGSVDTGFNNGAVNTGANWKIAPADIAEVIVTLLRMPRRTTISRVEIRPSRPPGKA